MPAAPPAVDFVVPQTPDEQRTSTKFFETLDFVLKYVPVLDTEEDLRAKFASIGIGGDTEARHRRAARRSAAGVARRPQRRLD